MRQFASGHFRLRETPASLRLTYGGFLVITAIGLATQFGFQAGRIGLSPAAIAAYYRGGEADGTMSFPKPFGHLLEVTHAHAFVMALIFLVLAHLFLGASKFSARAKRGVITAAFGGIVADLVTPWLIRYAGAVFAWGLLGAWLLLTVSGFVMVGLSLWDCLTGMPTPETSPNR